MHSISDLAFAAHDIIARADKNPSNASRPPIFKVIGICLAIGSGALIGTSFVLKKKGLLKANLKYNEEAGEGYGYLKNAWWWTGMTLMILGEILNFVAYAFTEAILVTPLGALSVVITTILSAIFLKERLSFVGKVACFLCIVGSVVIVLNAPTESSAATIQQMQHFVIAPGFLSYAGVILLVCAFLAFWAGPRYGKKSMMVYISICSLFGGLSVVATQGLGAAIVTQIGGTPQFNQWFLYVLLVFVVTTLVTEIVFLNKALNLFNAALVTPTYYVYFTSSTIITSAVLFRGFKGTPSSITTVVLGFLTICSGVVLLQLSKSAKDVPDAAVFKGDLDQVRTVAEQEQPESEPKADTIRGTAALIRRISTSRKRMEEEEAKRVYQERLSSLEPIGEDEQFEWDGIRRRRTTYGSPGPSGSVRKKTLHPPLGLTHFPEEEPERQSDSTDNIENGLERGLIGSIRQRAKSVWPPSHRSHSGTAEAQSPIHPVALTQISIPSSKSEGTPAQSYFGEDSRQGPDPSHVYGLPKGLRKPQDDSSQQAGETVLSPTGSMKSPVSARRQFSFQNVFNRHKEPQVHEPPSHTGPTIRPVTKGTHRSRHGSKDHSRSGSKGATEEERLGLVKGDSSAMLPLPDYVSDDEDWELEGKPNTGITERVMTPSEEKGIEAQYEAFKQRRKQSRASEKVPPVPAKDDRSIKRDKDPKDRKGSGSRGPSPGGSAFI